MQNEISLHHDAFDIPQAEVFRAQAVCSASVNRALWRTAGFMAADHEQDAAEAFARSVAYVERLLDDEPAWLRLRIRNRVQGRQR